MLDKELVGHENEDFEAMLEESFKKRDRDRVTTGLIVEIKESDDIALIDVGEKQEGILNLSELRDDEGSLKYNVNDELVVLVSGIRNERPQISHKKAIAKEKTREFIASLGEEFEGVLVEGTVKKINKGGFIVENAEGVSFFMPSSQGHMKNDKANIGKSVKAKIIKVVKDENNIVISRREYLDEDRAKKEAIIEKAIADEEILNGTIRKITSYGIFVQVAEGIDGLVRYNEISYKGPVNPSKHFNEGDEIEVKAINYDKEKRRLSLSIKQIASDPWDEIIEQLEVGDSIQVTVSNIENYGVFVDLGNDIEGLLHVSELTWDKKPKHPKEYVTLHDEIDVEVIEIDAENRRLRVSLKNLLERPFDEFLKNNRVGDVVTGTVTSLVEFGAFVKIGAVEGLLHNQDVSWSKNDKCKELFKVGDEVEVKIVKIDREKEKISLNRKELLESPLEVFAKTHRVNDVVEGTIKDIKDFGVFVKIDEGVEALIRTDDLPPLNVEELNAGDAIEAVIVALEAKKNKMRLSVRKLQRIKEQKVLSEINAQDDKMTLGDAIKDQLK